MSKKWWWRKVDEKGGYMVSTLQLQVVSDKLAASKSGPWCELSAAYATRVWVL